MDLLIGECIAVGVEARERCRHEVRRRRGQLGWGCGGNQGDFCRSLCQSGLRFASPILGVADACADNEDDKERDGNDGQTSFIPLVSLRGWKWRVVRINKRGCGWVLLVEMGEGFGRKLLSHFARRTNPVRLARSRRHQLASGAAVVTRDQNCQLGAVWAADNGVFVLRENIKNGCAAIAPDLTTVTDHGEILRRPNRHAFVAVLCKR